jgi:hypothetical protein
MTSPRSRLVDRITFVVSSIGVAGSAAFLIMQHGSRAWTQLVLAIASGVVFLGAITAAYLAYTAARFRLFSGSVLRQASRNSYVSHESIKSPLRDLLSAVTRDMADAQNLDPAQLRAALYRKDGNVLRIVPGLTWHLDDPEELQIEIGLGEGSAGKSFQTGRPNIAIYHEARNDTSLSDPLQRSRVDPSLKWVISAPILGQKGEVLGVLNVDGLTIERTWEQLRTSVGILIYWAQLAGLLLGAREETIVRAA